MVVHEISVVKVAASEHVAPSSVLLAFLPGPHVALAAQGGKHPKPMMHAVQPLAGVPVVAKIYTHQLGSSDTLMFRTMRKRRRRLR